MEEYHRIWAGKHGLDAGWLSQALLNGFDIHHVDGDHSNNDPDNLILVYSGDHMALHGLKRFSGRADGVWMTHEELAERRKTNGCIAYERRLSGVKWKDVGVPCAMLVAKHYAKSNGLEWPIPVRVQSTPEERRRARIERFPLMVS